VIRKSQEIAEPDRPEVPPQAQTLRAQSPSEASSTGAPTALSDAEDWATPAMQQELTPQPDMPIDPQILVIDQLLSPAQAPDTSQPQPSAYPLVGIEGALATQDAENWLNDIEWVHNTAEVAPSPPTSMATDTRTALGTTYKGCKCPEHQEIYSNWPTHDAELTISQCMKTCVYCGSDFVRTTILRKHLRTRKYAYRNLTISQGTAGVQYHIHTSWTPRPRAPNEQLDSELSIRPQNVRITRSQSLTNSPFTTPHTW
jgi:hypothetical protein